MVLMLVRAIYWSICQLDWLIVTVFRFDLTVPEHDNFVLEKMLSPNFEELAGAISQQLILQGLETYTILISD